MKALLLKRFSMMLNKKEPVRPDYLKLTAAQDSSTVTLSAVGSAPSRRFEYAVNGGDFSAYTLGTAISLDVEGDYVEFRRPLDDGVTTSIGSSSSAYHKFTLTGKIAASGNVMSLLDGKCKSVTLGNFALCRLFDGQTSLLQAPDLPATTLAINCYYYMFNNTRITSVVLPAETPKNYCYYGMFVKCSALTDIELHLRSLANSSLYDWLSQAKNTSDCTLRCYDELTLSSGTSGLPSNWNRVSLE